MSAVLEKSRKKRPDDFILIPATSDDTPPLEQGDVLSRQEFHRRYSAMPGVKKAELIEGVVHMPSPAQ